MSVPLDTSQPLLRSRRFWPLLGVQSLGPFADNLLRGSTIVAVFATAGAAFGSEAFSLPWGMAENASAVVSISFTLPIFLFSVISGQLADKIDRHTFLRWVKAAEIALMLFAAACFALGSGLVLIFALFLMGTQSAFFGPVRNALMPQYFPGADLPRANGWYNAAQFVAMVAGLFVGAAFTNAQMFGMAGGGRLLVAVILVVAAVLGTACAFLAPRAPAPGLARIDWNVPRVAARQYAHVFSMRPVFYPMLGVSWFWGLSAFNLANLPNFIRDELGRGDGAFAGIMVVIAVGSALGSIVAGTLAGRVRQPFVLAGVGVAGTILAAAATWWFARGVDPGVAGGSAALTLTIAAITLAAASNSVFAVPMMAAVQGRAPEAERARVMGTLNMTNGGLATLGSFIVPPLRGAGLDAGEVFLAGAAMQTLLLAFMVKRRADVRAGRAAPSRTGRDAPPLPT